MDRKPVVVGVGAAAVTIALALAGCTPGQTTSDTEYGPIAEFFGASWGLGEDEEEMTRRVQEDERERQEIVAECMAGEGFEYVPDTQTGMISFSSGDEWSPDDREWVSRYGYGIVDWPGRDEISDDAGEEWVDPNQDYLQSLSESEQLAFSEALSGPMPTDEQMEDPDFFNDPANQGCWGQAQEQLSQNDPWSMAEFQPTVELLNSFYMTSADDPRFADLNLAWSTCMDEAGYPGLTRQFDAQERLYQEQTALYEENPEGLDDGSPQMQDFQEREIAQALADLDCREQTDYRETYSEIQFALEEQFLEDNRSSLEALRAAMEQRN